MKRLIPTILILLVNVFSQNLPSPPWLITSDYGPRNHPGTKYDWHWGIDYDGDMWDPIEAVASGDIVSIGYFTYGVGHYIWHIDIHSVVEGNDVYFYYLHIFQDVAPNNLPNYSPVGEYPAYPNGQYELDRLTLEDPINPNNTEVHYVIIFWINRNDNRAERVLSTRGGWYVQWGNDYIRDQNGELILTRRNIDQGEVIGPVGTSGGVGDHLHLASSSYYAAGSPHWYDINPLFYVQHDEPDYDITIHHPEPDALFYHRPSTPEAQQRNERIKMNMDSDPGLDLDRGFVYFFNLGETRVFDDAHRYAKILYGGAPPNYEYPTPFPSRITDDDDPNEPSMRGSITQSGVDPQGDVPGNDDFYFIGGLSEGGFQFNTKINKEGTLDERLWEVEDFIDANWVNKHLEYGGACYIAGVIYVIDSRGDIVTGLAICDPDTTVQREAGAVVAYERLSYLYYDSVPNPRGTFGQYWAQITAHELGHCFNMNHCSSAGCIMDSAVNLAADPHKYFCSDTCKPYLKKYWP